MNVNVFSLTATVSCPVSTWHGTQRGPRWGWNPRLPRLPPWIFAPRPPANGCPKDAGLPALISVQRSRSGRSDGTRGANRSTTAAERRLPWIPGGRPGRREPNAAAVQQTDDGATVEPERPVPRDPWVRASGSAVRGLFQRTPSAAGTAPDPSTPAPRVPWPS